MRPTTRFVPVLLLIAFCQALSAQTTYPITASLSTSSFMAFNSCNNCIFDLSPGVVLTVNSNVSCTSCTFNGGTVNFSSGSVTLNGTNSFNNDTVLINEALNVNSMNFSGDSVAVNKALTYNTGGTTVVNTALSITANFTYNSITFTDDSIHSSAKISGNAITFNGTDMAMTGTSTLSGSSVTITGGSITSAGAISSGSSMTLSGDTLTTTGGSISASSITATANGTISDIISLGGSTTLTTGGTMSLTNTTMTTSGSATLTPNAISMTTGTLTMSGTSSITAANSSMTFTSSSTHLNGNSFLSSNKLTLQTGSYLQIGDGTGTSNAYVYSKNAPNIDDNSDMSVANHDNYYYSTSNSFSTAAGSKSIAGNTISCGGGSPENACKANYVYGCATMNSGGAVACISLALPDMTFTAALAANNSVDLSWTDAGNNTAASYLIQRSVGNDTWTGIASITADGFSSDDYHYQDNSAPAGNVSYRIARTDHEGNTTYSTISTVTISQIRNTVSIFPNPASGHLFYINAPNTDQLILNVYTLTGQLIMRKTLQGQTQYPVELPAHLLSGATLVIQTILRDQSASMPLLLR